MLKINYFVKDTTKIAAIAWCLGVREATVVGLKAELVHVFGPGPGRPSPARPLILHADRSR